MEYNKTNAVGWFEIYVDDMDRAQKFYEGVLGRTLEALPMPEGCGEMKMLSFPGDMERYGSNGSLVQMDGFPAGNNSVLIYFSSEDCAIEEGRVVENGGKVEKSKQSIGEYGFISILQDTEGNMFGLHSMK